MLSLLSNEFSNRDDGGCKAGASPVVPEFVDGDLTKRPKAAH